VAADSAALGGWCPQPWGFGARLIAAKHLILTATKYRMLCMLLGRTCTVNVGGGDGGGAEGKKKKTNRMEKSTVEIIQPPTTDHHHSSATGSANGSATGSSYFAQCCALFPSLPASTLRYGDGTKQLYCVRVRFQTNTANTGGDIHFSSIQGQDHLHDWYKYQQELFLHVANDLNEERTGLFLRGYHGGFGGGGGGNGAATLVPLFSSTEHVVHGLNRDNALKCVGWMIGVALRTRTSFPLRFAPLVWKLLVDPTVPLTAEDLAPLDSNGALAHLEREASAQAAVRARVVAVRLRRVKQAMWQVRSGLLDILPGHSLALFTWDEIKDLVAGKKE
jgi:hypothetical protein